MGDPHSEPGPEHWRKRACRLILAFAIFSTGCIADRPRPCSTHSECSDGVCDTRGFCSAECTQNTDCPCGTYCATGCGLCIAADNQGAGTCFAQEKGLGQQEVLGVCRDALRATSPDSGICDAAESIVLQCLEPTGGPSIDDAGSEVTPDVPLTGWDASIDAGTQPRAADASSNASDSAASPDDQEAGSVGSDSGLLSPDTQMDSGAVDSGPLATDAGFQSDAAESSTSGETSDASN